MPSLLHGAAQIEPDAAQHQRGGHQPGQQQRGLGASAQQPGHSGSTCGRFQRRCSQATPARSTMPTNSRSNVP